MTFAYLIAHSSLCFRADVSLRLSDAISFFSSSFVSINLFVRFSIQHDVFSEHKVEPSPRAVIIFSIYNPSSESSSSAILPSDCLLHQSSGRLPQLILIRHSIFSCCPFPINSTHHLVDLIEIKGVHDLVHLIVQYFLSCHIISSVVDSLC
jgi:hypothetical protein